MPTPHSVNLLRRSRHFSPPKVASDDGGNTDRTLVGLWDVQHQFPKLEELVDRWNKAQNAYHFEVVDPSAPFGAWQMRKKTLYLRSDVVARRLEPTVKQLGIDNLVCICAPPMCDGDTLDLFADGVSPVLLISTWGFRVAERDTDRFLTNLVAGELISLRADVPTSQKLPRDSLFYYNKEQEVVGASCVGAMHACVYDDFAPSLSRILGGRAEFAVLPLAREASQLRGQPIGCFVDQVWNGANHEIVFQRGIFRPRAFHLSGKPQTVNAASRNEVSRINCEQQGTRHVRHEDSSGG